VVPDQYKSSGRDFLSVDDFGIDDPVLFSSVSWLVQLQAGVAWRGAFPLISDPTTDEFIRQLTLDATRNYQPNIRAKKKPRSEDRGV